MYAVLAPGTDFRCWRDLVRGLVRLGIPPEKIDWRTEAASADPDTRSFPPQQPDGGPAFTVPAAFLDLARAALLHRDPARFALLYRLVWRLRMDPTALARSREADLVTLRRLAAEVRRDQQRMTARLRFREVGRERSSRLVAWCEPAHHIVEASAPFFERRYADMPWSILTPDRCAHWDGMRTIFTAGLARPEPPVGDALEDAWRRYLAQAPAFGGTSPGGRRLVP